MKGDDGSGTGSQPPRSRKCRNICFSVCGAVIVIVLILVVLCFTVYKAKDPEMTVDSVVLRNLQADFDVNRVRVDVNITLDVYLTIKNPNKAGFKYTNSTAALNYRGELVGQVPVGAGKISADETKFMTFTLTVMGDRLLGKIPELLPDVVAGTIPFNTVTRISGKVTVLGIIKVHVVSTSSCDFDVYVGNKTIGDLVCKSKTKL